MFFKHALVIITIYPSAYALLRDKKILSFSVKK